MGFFPLYFDFKHSWELESLSVQFDYLLCINPLLFVFEIQEMATGIYKGLLYEENEIKKS